MELCSINWGSVADWASAVGSLSAVITALYLSRSAERIRLIGYCGPRTLLNTRGVQGDVLFISVTNVGHRPTLIKGVGMRTGLFRKRFVIITMQKDDISDGLPNPISDGEEAKWGIPLDNDREWLKDLCKTFIRSSLDIKTLRIIVSTSHGERLVIRPEKSLREALRDIVYDQKSK